MAEDPATIVEVPPYHQMFWPTLLAIKSLGNSGTNQEIDDRAIEIAAYTEAQQAIVHGDGPKSEIRYRMAWARTYLKAIGALENSARGVWSVTEYGESLTEQDMPDIPARVRAITSQRPKRTKTRGLEVVSQPAIEEPVEVVGRVLTSTVPQVWQGSLLEVVQSIAPDAFEKLCQRVLRESGFTRVDVTGRSGDGESTASAFYGSLSSASTCSSSANGTREVLAHPQFGTSEAPWWGEPTRVYSSPREASRRTQNARPHEMVPRYST